jgi:hypothetical protein
MALITIPVQAAPTVREFGTRRWRRSDIDARIARATMAR